MNKIKDKTESGDLYSGTEEAWARYRQAVNEDNWELVLYMEEGFDEDFTYEPYTG